MSIIEIKVGRAGTVMPSIHVHVIGVTCHWDSCHHPEWDANSIIDLCPLLSESEGGEERGGWRALAASSPHCGHEITSQGRLD